jgi:hypothetical protein
MPGSAEVATFVVSVPGARRGSFSFRLREEEALGRLLRLPMSLPLPPLRLQLPVLVLMLLLLLLPLLLEKLVFFWLLFCFLVCFLEASSAYFLAFLYWRLGKGNK